ncbi:hypothetical protein VTP01DRAFT_3576 [Rhizomucor pusillus]|uniref:uncharacterized protein n=1 Tax=Rhizomucor pusillus TaxID=4840 RepID=UPI003742342A
MPESETVFNFWLIHPFLPIVATASQDVKRLKCDFVPGETAFASITKQLIALGKHKDDRYQYSANATFGALTMLKALTDNFPYGMMEHLSKVKTFLLHAAGNGI